MPPTGHGSGLPSAEIDAAGNIYVAWQDCRFRSGCSSNGIVYSTSSNGTTWSAVTRVPIDATISSVDHFIPGFGIDHTTSGSTAELGLYCSFHPNANCSRPTCQLAVGFISSINAGATWSTLQTVAGPMSLAQVAGSTQGSTVGDYISTSMVNGRSVSIFAVGKTPTNGQAFDESLYTVAGGLALRSGTTPSTNGPVLFSTANHPTARITLPVRN
ncbi:hypothetical protein ABZ845_08735 [Streptomyces sp. NPDC047022]|uniref:hypothetical protein n=1 Tax=Streptomyces sp. NPDC047022 TaxID=3155737 RepID=UPI0033ED9243